jgi:hypothetical protein
MLASITPLGERGRRSNWRVTVSAFLIGATVAAAGAGAALGALGSIVLTARPGVAVLLAAIGVAIVLDGLPIAVPGPRRQVDERWLDRYRSWVYGAGYGAQLGLGVTTIVSSAATYVAILAAFLTASAPAGAVVLGCFGVVRGLIPVTTAGVRDQRQLLDFHRELARWRGLARWGAMATLAGMLVFGLALL